MDLGRWGHCQTVALLTACALSPVPSSAPQPEVRPGPFQNSISGAVDCRLRLQMLLCLQRRTARQPSCQEVCC